MRILKDGFIYLSGELVNKLLPFILLPYLTRKLGVAGFGELSYYLTILALLTIFIGFSQEGAVTRYYYFYGKRGMSLIVKSGYLLNLLFSIVCLFVCWFVFRSEILFLIVIISMFNSFLRVQLAIRQCQRQPKLYILIQLTNSLMVVFFTVIIMEYYEGNQVFNRIFALTLSGLLTFLLTYFFINKKFNKNMGVSFSFRRYKLGVLYLISFGFPLIFHQASSFIKGQIDRIFIYKIYTPDELGVYSVGVQVASILTIVLLSLNKAVVPYYYEALKSGKLTVLKIKKYTIFSFILVGLPALINYFIPERFFEWFLGEGFSGVKDYITLFLIGYGLMLPYFILVNYFFYYAKNSLISFVTISSSMLYLLLLVFFIYNFDSLYVPFALIISNMVLVYILWYFIAKVNVESPGVG